MFARVRSSKNDRNRRAQNPFAAATFHDDLGEEDCVSHVARARATEDVRTRRACCGYALRTSLRPARTYATTRTTPTH